MAITNAVNATTPGFQSLTSAGVWNGRTLQQGTGITITNADGVAGDPTISSSATGSVTWTTTAVNVANMTVGTGYFCISAGGALTLGLPAASVLGDTVRVSLDGATSWQITQAAGQRIRAGSSQTTLGAGGSLMSTAQGDSIELVCRVANTLWVEQSSEGNFTVV